MHRSAVRLCHKWSPEKTTTDQKAEQKGEVREHRDYYNMIPGKMPPAGGTEDLRITTEEDSVDLQQVRVGFNTKTQTVFSQLSWMSVLNRFWPNTSALHLVKAWLFTLGVPWFLSLSPFTFSASPISFNHISWPSSADWVAHLSWRWISCYNITLEECYDANNVLTYLLKEHILYYILYFIIQW